MVSSNSTSILTHVQTNSEPLDQGLKASRDISSKSTIETLEKAGKYVQS